MAEVSTRPSKPQKPIAEVFAEAIEHGFGDFRVTKEGIEWGEPHHGAWCETCSRFRRTVRARYAEAETYVKRELEGKP